MPYDKFNKRIKIMASQTWVTFDHFEHVLHNLNTLSYNLQAHRDQGLQIINDLHRESHIFSKTDRFPDKLYVNIDHSDWPDKLSQIITGLAYRTPDATHTNKNLNDGQDKHSQGRPTRGNQKEDITPKHIDEINDQSERDKLEKAVLSIYKGISSAIHQLNQGVATHSQDDFESEFGLTWTA